MNAQYAALLIKVLYIISWLILRTLLALYRYFYKYLGHNGVTFFLGLLLSQAYEILQGRDQIIFTVSAHSEIGNEGLYCTLVSTVLINRILLLADHLLLLTHLLAILGAAVLCRTWTCRVKSLQHCHFLDICAKILTSPLKFPTKHLK